MKLFAVAFAGLLGLVVGGTASFWLAMYLGGVFSVSEAAGYLGIVIAVLVVPLGGVLASGAAMVLTARAFESRSRSVR
jgi:hypothetical protein